MMTLSSVGCIGPAVRKPKVTKDDFQEELDWMRRKKKVEAKKPKTDRDPLQPTSERLEPSRSGWAPHPGPAPARRSRLLAKGRTVLTPTVFVSFPVPADGWCASGCSLGSPHRTWDKDSRMSWGSPGLLSSVTPCSAVPVLTHFPQQAPHLETVCSRDHRQGRSLNCPSNVRVV